MEDVIEIIYILRKSIREYLLNVRTCLKMYLMRKKKHNVENVRKNVRN